MTSRPTAALSGLMLVWVRAQHGKPGGNSTTRPQPLTLQTGGSDVATCQNCSTRLKKSCVQPSTFWTDVKSRANVNGCQTYQIESSKSQQSPVDLVRRCRLHQRTSCLVVRRQERYTAWESVSRMAFLMEGTLIFPFFKIVKILISLFQNPTFSAPPCAVLNCRNLFISSYLSAFVVYDLAMVTLVFFLFVYSIIITSAESEA